MQKQAKKHIVFVAISLFLMSPVSFALNNEANIPVVQDTSVNSRLDVAHKRVQVKHLDVEPMNTEKVKKTVVPDAKQEGKKVIGLFLKVMSGVMICSIFLYFVLLLVKKYYGSAFMAQEYEEEFEIYNLTSPSNKVDALKSFLNRTK